MELNPTPFPVKSRCIEPKPTTKISEPPKIGAKSRSSNNIREKRVFGTTKNPNIPPASEKPAKAKLPTSMVKKVTKASGETQSPTLVAEAKNSSEKHVRRIKKKSVCFKEGEIERNEKISRDGNATEPQTPVNSSAVGSKPRRVSTPYRTAEICSKCRFDKLETSAHWLGQIKLAESVAKHSVSAAFFELALDCNAEPIRNTRVELKKYLALHEHLNAEQEWKNLSIKYGLVKEEAGVNEEDNSLQKGTGEEDQD